MTVDPGSRGWNEHVHRLVWDGPFTLPFGAGWQDYGGVWTPCAHSRDGSGVVHLRGLVTTNSATTPIIGSTLATLPVGFRPTGQHMFVAVSYNPGYGVMRLDVTPAGVISPVAVVAGPAWAPSVTPQTVFISLAGITFRTI